MQAFPEQGSPLLASPSFYLGSRPVIGDLILSPMDGFSDLPFRSICRSLGSAVSYTEFVNVLDYRRDRPDVVRKLAFTPDERPVVFQIFDSDPDRLLEASLRLQELGPDAIDINMGCCAKNVSGRGAGAGLLLSPLTIARIFRRLSQALSVPVTGKIRLGWDENCLNYRLVARVIEESGGALLAVHGRTRQQGYSARADWDAIAEIRRSVSIPVIGNGDVQSAADITLLKAHTGCHAVMIGRAAIGNPWIFSRRDRITIPPDEVRAVLLRHLQLSLDFYGPEFGLVLFRKHASRYISPYGLPDALRRRLLTAREPSDLVGLVNEITG